MIKATLSTALTALFLATALPAAAGEDAAFSGQPKTVLTEKSEFDRSALMTSGASSVSGLSFGDPGRFAMKQSYSMSFSSGSFGSHSAGLYLNTLSYRLADPLTLTADVGFYTPFYSSLPGMRSASFRDSQQGSSLVFPHVGLEYKPSKNTSLSLHMFNGPDAAKAYGYDSFLSPWAR